MSTQNPSPTTAIDDLVPGGARTGVCGHKSCEGHTLEHRVQNWLMQHPGLVFAQLVVRRNQDTLCLEGILHSDEGCPDLDVMLGDLTGITRIINNLRVVPLADSSDVR